MRRRLAVRPSAHASSRDAGPPALRGCAARCAKVTFDRDEYQSQIHERVGPLEALGTSQESEAKIGAEVAAKTAALATYV